ncbi:hypothetical protein L9F63_025251, partial [Diploptera punctata]
IALVAAAVFSCICWLNDLVRHSALGYLLVNPSILGKWVMESMILGVRWRFCSLIFSVYHLKVFFLFTQSNSPFMSHSFSVILNGWSLKFIFVNTFKPLANPDAFGPFVSKKCAFQLLLKEHDVPLLYTFTCA